jgi:hypothetical protein
VTLGEPHSLKAIDEPGDRTRRQTKLVSELPYSQLFVPQQSESVKLNGGEFGSGPLLKPRACFPTGEIAPDISIEHVQFGCLPFDLLQ